MSGTSAEAARSRPASIFSPIIDFLCVGGLSIIVLVPLLLSGRQDLGFLGSGALVWVLFLVNYSHFMASYRIIYRDRQMILRHQWASMGVPLILLGFAALALVTAPTTEAILVLFVIVASGYLAWHYTGQVWGMMASFAFLDGNRFDTVERWLIRGGLRILLAWHVSWFLNVSLSDPTFVVRLDVWFSEATVTSLGQFASVTYQTVTYLTVAAFLLGGIGLVRFRLRTGRFAPFRSLTAWLAIFTWYAAFWRWGPPALLLVQAAHAVQYLEFPARVEINRAARNAAARKLGHMVWYAVVLVAVSFAVILAVPGPAMSAVANFLGISPQKVAPVLILSFINIHHYFTDGVAWKISNPEVRKELFAHVLPAAPTTTGGRRIKKTDQRLKY